MLADAEYRQRWAMGYATCPLMPQPLGDITFKIRDGMT
jgi:hypothetical protein